MDDEKEWHEDRCGKCGRSRLNCECLRQDIDERDPYDRAMDRMDRSYDDWASQ